MNPKFMTEAQLAGEIRKLAMIVAARTDKGRDKNTVRLEALRQELLLVRGKSLGN